MVRNPFAHQDGTPGGDAGPKHHGIPLAGWLRREESRFSRGRSSLFLSGHDDPLPPQATCLQGHEIPPGETTCSHGHPAG